MVSPLPDDPEYLHGMIIALEAQRRYLLEGLLNTFTDVPSTCRQLLQSSFATQKISKAVASETTKPRLMEGLNDGWSAFNGLLIEYGLDPTHVRERRQ